MSLSHALIDIGPGPHMTPAPTIPVYAGDKVVGHATTSRRPSGNIAVTIDTAALPPEHQNPAAVKPITSGPSPGTSDTKPGTVGLVGVELTGYSRESGAKVLRPGPAPIPPRPRVPGIDR